MAGNQFRIFFLALFYFFSSSISSAQFLPSRGPTYPTLNAGHSPYKVASLFQPYQSYSPYFGYQGYGAAPVYSPAYSPIFNPYPAYNPYNPGFPQAPYNPYLNSPAQFHTPYNPYGAPGTGSSPNNMFKVVGGAIGITLGLGLLPSLFNSNKNDDYYGGSYRDRYRSRYSPSYTSYSGRTEGDYCVGCSNSSEVLGPQNGDTASLLAEIDRRPLAERMNRPERIITAEAPAVATERVETTITGSQKDAIEKYSNSQQVNDMVSWAMRNKVSSSIGACKKFVKEAMANKCSDNPTRTYRGRVVDFCRAPFPRRNHKHLTNTVAGANLATNSVPELERDGFVNLLNNAEYRNLTPKTAPRGAILIYAGGPRQLERMTGQMKQMGHIEIKTAPSGSDGYVSDFYQPRPATGWYSNGHLYRLIGVMIKPDPDK